MGVFVIAVNGAPCCVVNHKQIMKKERGKRRMETRKKNEGKEITRSVRTEE